jgi:hypothetical protein
MSSHHTVLASGLLLAARQAATAALHWLGQPAECLRALEDHCHQLGLLTAPPAGVRLKRFTFLKSVYIKAVSGIENSVMLWFST